MPFRLFSLVSASLLATCVMTLTSGCNDDVNDPATGNIDRLADAVFVQPDSTRVPRQSYVFVSNPDLEVVRVFDAYEHRFVRAPNVYFPLSLPVGPSTRRLAVAPADHTRVFALDGVEDRVYVMRATDDGGTALTVVNDVIVGTRRAPADIAASTIEGGVRLYVSIPDDGLVQVLDVLHDADGATEVALIDLGDDARPGELDVDPTEDALLIGDAVHDRLTVVRLEDLEVDRVLDVGGAVTHISTGLVDPGDGLAPMALVGLRGESAVTAVRLFRPTHREERYAVLGTVELAAPVAAAYLPKQEDTDLTERTVCCVGLNRLSEATYGWATVLTTTGDMYYLRLDGETSDDDDNARGVARLVDNDETDPSVTDPTWSPAADDPIDTPVVTATSVGFEGYAALSSPGALTLTWEGQLPFGAHASASLDDADDLVVFSRSIGEATVGDVVVFDVDGREGPCPDTLERTIVDAVDTRTFDVGAFSDDERSCLTFGGNLTASVRAPNAWVANSTVHGHVGRLARAGEGGDLDDELLLDGFVVQVASDVPHRDSTLSMSFAQNISAVGMLLSRQPTSNDPTGFGIGALYPSAMVGGEVSVPTDSDVVNYHTRRIYMVTGTGSLLTFNETETNLANVLDLQ